MNRFLIFCLGFLCFSCLENTIQTNGNVDQIELPDGTVVMLNENSSLNYDPLFRDRSVTFKGEAFFEVSKGETPFTISTDLGEIRVLGTAFHVKSGEDDLEVQVKEGLVELKNSDLIGRIEDGMKATVKKGEKQFKKVKADLNFDEWLGDMKKEWKSFEKNLQKEAKKLKKEGEKLKKELEKESEKIGEEVKKETEKLREKIKTTVED